MDGEGGGGPVAYERHTMLVFGAQIIEVRGGGGAGVDRKRRWREWRRKLLRRVQADVDVWD